MRRKEERSKQGQTNNKLKQHSTPKAVTFPKNVHGLGSKLSVFSLRVYIIKFYKCVERKTFPSSLVQYLNLHVNAEGQGYHLHIVHYKCGQPGLVL